MTLLEPIEGPAAIVINPQRGSQIILACEHASRFIPHRLNNLGLDETGSISHAAWDPGALDVAETMSKILKCPLVASRVSRLVYDCNRPKESKSAIPERSEVISVPGNQDISETERQERYEDVYLPFRRLLSEVIAGSTPNPVLVTVHSFTPIYFGKKRDVEVGFLHDRDDRLACAMLDAAASMSPWQIALNAPYAMTDGVTYTLSEHAISSGLLNVMIEIRNDLISSPNGASSVASKLCEILRTALTEVGSRDYEAVQAQWMGSI